LNDADWVKFRALEIAWQRDGDDAFERTMESDLVGFVRIVGAVNQRAMREALGMPDTTFHVQEEALQRLALPFSNDPDPWIFEWLNVTKVPKRFFGAGGLASTASNYYRVLQMLLNGGVLDGARVLSPMTVRWAMADDIGTMRGMLHPGDGYRGISLTRYGLKRVARSSLAASAIFTGDHLDHGQLQMKRVAAGSARTKLAEKLRSRQVAAQFRAAPASTSTWAKRSRDSAADRRFLGNRPQSQAPPRTCRTRAGSCSTFMPLSVISSLQRSR
jgi:hypothetical protein